VDSLVVALNNLLDKDYLVPALILHPNKCLEVENVQQILEECLEEELKHYNSQLEEYLEEVAVYLVEVLKVNHL
jgi:hypothetical protein